MPPTPEIFVPYVTMLQIVAMVTLVLIFLSSIDDLFVDAVFWGRKVRRILLGRDRIAPVPQQVLYDQPEKHLAIMIPAWHEHEVIGSMVEAAIATLDYANYVIFIGVYANDAETIAETERLTQRQKKVVRVAVPHDGPTCKADCLNFIVEAILAHEKQQGIEFAGMILHDSEDVLHPIELKFFNYLMPQKDLVQLPVVSLEQRYRDLIAGTYMDEFAEWHAKDLVVRERIARAVPSAGVGTCFSRNAMMVLMQNGTKDPFSTETLTEDYDVATRLSAHGLSSIIALYPVEFRVKRGAIFGIGPHRVAQLTMPLCVREHFPNTFRTSYRQKARWALGIALQGWAQLGWTNSITTNYFLFRDRKAIITPTLAVVAYFLLANFIVLNVYASLNDYRNVRFFSSDPAVLALLGFNVFALSARVVQRVYFVERIYGWGHATLSLVRIFVVSIVNFAATMRALRIYFMSLITRDKISWDKTAHRFPTGDWLGERRRPLGEILLSWETVRPVDVETALMEQESSGQPLGQILMSKGLLNDRVLAEALSVQNDLPLTELTEDAVRAHADIIPPDVIARLRTVPIGSTSKGELILAVARPLNKEELERMQARLNRNFVQRIAAESEVVAAISIILGDDPSVRASLEVPMLHHLLVEQKFVSRRKIDAAMSAYDPARDGTIGEFLTKKKVVTQSIVDEVASDQKSQLIERWEETS